MSMDRCKCGQLVDTDEHPEAYIYKDGQQKELPEYKREHACVCSLCQENMMENLTEEDWMSRQP